MKARSRVTLALDPKGKAQPWKQSGRSSPKKRALTTQKQRRFLKLACGIPMTVLSPFRIELDIDLLIFILGRRLRRKRGLAERYPIARSTSSCNNCIQERCGIQSAGNCQDPFFVPDGAWLCDFNEQWRA
jgi:hypothetical protein